MELATNGTMRVWLAGRMRTLGERQMGDGKQNLFSPNMSETQ